MKRIIPFLLLYVFLNPALAGLFDDDELLPVEQAFSVQASATDAETLQLDWRVADGYYLYRDKLKFVSNSDGIKLGLPSLPAGKVKHDEFFGDVETYRGDIRVSIPITRTKGSPGTLALQVSSQGCADRGVCYPPHKQVLTIKLPEQNSSASGSAIKTLSSLGLSFGLGDEDELLPADEAFRLNVDVIDPQTIVARWDIAEGYYLYRDKFGVTATPDSPVTPLPLQMPDGKKKTDETFGDVEVYYQHAEARIPLQRSTPQNTEVALTFAYQGCAERGVCYPPIKKVINVLLPEAAAASATDTGSVRPLTTTEAAPQLSEQDALAKRLLEGNTLLTLLAFFGFGLLLAFTPCVFPMIPILSSIIVGQGEKITARRGFVLSSVYVLAMALTYTAAGVIAGLFGQNLQAAFQNPWVLSTFATVFVLLALSMFGFYDLQMPAALQSRLTEASNRQKGGNLTGVAVMGFLSALIVGPCVAAPLAAALIVIGQTGNAVLGGMALFALSMGMGAPLIAIGTGAGKLLPKAGGWMDAIKAVFGVLLLAVAIWMLERILPGAVTLTLWAVLLIVSSIYMGALTHITDTTTGWKKLWKGTGVVTLTYGVLLLIGAATGGNDPLRPLSNLNLASGGGTVTEQAHLPFKMIKSVDDLNRELELAKSQHKPVMLDFYADWCISCKEMEKYTFEKAEVHEALSHMTLLQADVTANDDADKALLKHFDLIGPPSIIFYDATGQERPSMRLVGYIKADKFVEHLKPLRP